MVEFIEGIINAIGYIGVGVLTFAENIFPPIPSELVIPFAGFAARQQQFSLIGMIIAGTVGSLVGAVLLYYLGVRLSEERLMRFADRHGKWIGLSGEDIQRASMWLNRRGSLAVFICRLVPGLRSVISIPAGISEMNFAVFLFWTTLGTLIWTSALAVAGYLLGQNYEQISPYMDIIGTIVFVGLVVFIAVRVWRKHHQPDENSEQEHETRTS